MTDQPEDLEEPETPQSRRREHLVVRARQDYRWGAYCNNIWKYIVKKLAYAYVKAESASVLSTTQAKPEYRQLLDSFLGGKSKR